MTDDRLDPRFERALRASLTELEPGEVPASLQVAVAAVPRRVTRRPSNGLRMLAAMGAVAAAVVVAVAAVGLVDRLATPITPVAASPSVPVSVPGDVLSVVLEPVDASADLDAVAEVLRVRLAAAGFDDAVVRVDGGRIVADVTVDRAVEGLAASAGRLLTAPGSVEAVATGTTFMATGETIDPGQFPVVFDGGDVSEARVQDDPATLTLLLDADGTEGFGEYSSTHVGEYVAIALDGVVFLAPSINEPIMGGSIELSGIDALDGPGVLGARELAAILESGPLPAPVRLADGPSPEPASPAPSPDPSAAPTISPVDPGSLQYVCSQFPFPAALLDEDRFDERADRPEAEALRAHLAMVGPDYDWLPDQGWALAGADDVGAEYVAKLDDGTVAYAYLSREGGWRVDGWGDCQPRMDLDGGIGPATWALAPGQDIGPETTTFDALVTEQACSGAQPADGRIVGPDIIAVGDTVLVTFGVRPREGPQTCPGNPSTRVTVTLPEPLGDRRLLDGSTTPPRAPAAP